MSPQNVETTMQEFVLPASKSLSNRWLVANYVCGGKIDIQNLSDAADTKLMVKLLKRLNRGSYYKFHCCNAGTVARFMLALLCTAPGTHLLDCCTRMKKRPMAELIDALRSMGANIRCLEKEGHLPVAVEGGTLSGGEVRLTGDTSSQFASALLLVAPKMTTPLTLKFDRSPVSKPYISMTCEVMRACGHEVEEQPLLISVRPACQVHPFSVVVENDWSSAAYAYNMVAFSPKLTLFLPGLKMPSLQGDSIAARWYRELGVDTAFVENGIWLTHRGLQEKKPLVFHCSDNPDLVPPLAVACAALGLDALFADVHTLKYKESNRLTALAAELRKLGCNCQTTHSTLHVLPSHLSVDADPISGKQPVINTYADHRMAMSFQTLACILDTGHDFVDRPWVVFKSFPKFYDNFYNIVCVK